MHLLEPLTAAGKALLILVALNIFYRALFRFEARTRWAHLVITRTRFWAYASMLVVVALWFVTDWETMPGRTRALSMLNVIVSATVAALLVEAMVTLVYDYFLVHRRQASVPALFRDLGKGVIYLLLIGLYLWKVQHINVAPMLTTSAIFSIILGLALQDTLGNVFAGLALHLSHPFSIGDWVKLGTDEGKVEKIDWRATSILTLSGDYVIIPNNTLAKADIRNYSTPLTTHARIVMVDAHYRHPPNQVVDTLLAAAKDAEGVLGEPLPNARLLHYGDFSITYELKFWINEFDRYRDIESNVTKQIWYHFKRSGIIIPFPIRDVFHHQPGAAADALGDGAVLRTIDFLSPLSDDELASLARSLRHEIYPRGKALFNQGDPGDRFYVVKSGTVEVIVKNSAGEVIFTTTLAQGSFFGEMSLLTGEPRTAAIRMVEDTELLSLGKEDLKDLMSHHTHLDELICDAISARQAHTMGRIAESEAAASRKAGERDAGQQRTQLLNSIRSFFSY